MSWNRDEVTCLIEEFRKWPNLYKVKSVNYKNRNLRRTALEAIQEELRNVKPSVTIQKLQNKFQALKQNATKEYKKWVCSYKSGTGPDEIYEPSLWYFEIISFVFEASVSRVSQDTLDDTNEELSQQSAATVDDLNEDKRYEIISGVVSPDGIISPDLESRSLTLPIHLSPSTSACTSPIHPKKNLKENQTTVNFMMQ